MLEFGQHQAEGKHGVCEVALFVPYGGMIISNGQVDPPNLLVAEEVRERHLVLATGPSNPPAVQVWTAKMGRFSSRTVQKPDPQTLGGPNPDPYLSTRGFRPVWLDPSFPISGSAFRVSYLWSYSDMRLFIVKY